MTTRGQPTDKDMGAGQQVLEKLYELLQHGHGRLEVVVQDHQVKTIHQTKAIRLS